MLCRPSRMLGDFRSKCTTKCRWRKWRPSPRPARFGDPDPALDSRLPSRLCRRADDESGCSVDPSASWELDYRLQTVRSKSACRHTTTKTDYMRSDAAKTRLRYQSSSPAGSLRSAENRSPFSMYSKIISVCSSVWLAPRNCNAQHGLGYGLSHSFSWHMPASGHRGSRVQLCQIEPTRSRLTPSCDCLIETNSQRHAQRW